MLQGRGYFFSLSVRLSFHSELVVSSTRLLLVLRQLGFTLVSWLRRLGGDEEREKVVHDVGGRNARDVCMVIRRCDFNNVRAAASVGE